MKEKYNVKRVYGGGFSDELILAISFSASMPLFFLSLISFMGKLDLPKDSFMDFLVAGILLIVGPVGFYNAHKAKKKKEIEDRLPDFLREVGSSTSSGTTVFDAIRMASNGDFGALTKEIKLMSSQLSWGIPIKEVLLNFSKRLKSKPVERAVLTINKAIDMGGNTSDAFYAAAKEIEQIKLVERQRKVEMSMYSLVILVSFFVFLAVILIINSMIFSSFFSIQEKLGGAEVGGLSFGGVDKYTLKCAFFSFILVHSIGAGLLGGFMMDGKLSSGVRYVFLLVLISFLAIKFLM